MAVRIAELEAKLEELAAENAKLVRLNEALRDRIVQLESELSRDSRNSSKPPSTDPQQPRQTRAERRAAARAAGRRQGKQPGAPGANLARRVTDATVAHPPACCEGCGADLAGAEVVGEVRRQVLEIPEIRVRAVDHVAERRRCATVGTRPSGCSRPRREHRCVGGRRCGRWPCT